MIVSRYHPRTEQNLATLVEEATRGARSVVIQAGHFLLHYDAQLDRLLPCIAEELSEPRHDRFRHEAGEFPLLTWALGLELLASIPRVAKHVMTVVNDWQYVPKGIDRKRFYATYRRLPASYREMLDNVGGSVNLLTPPINASTHPFFGEMNLRNQYKRTVERLIKSGTLPPNSEVRSHGADLVCNLRDWLGREQEVYCSNKTGDCAAEIAQMLRVARTKVGCDCFINFYPAVCQNLVEAGTELGEHLLRNGIPTVLNVGFPSSAVATRDDLLAGCECALHRFPRETAIQSAKGGVSG